MMGVHQCGVSLLICAWPVLGASSSKRLAGVPSFRLHTLVGGVLLAAIALFLAESNVHPRSACQRDLVRSLSTTGLLLLDRRFLGYTICNAPQLQRDHGILF